MRKLLLLLLMIGFVTFSYSQITVLPQTSNIVLIGKIKIGNADASSFFRPKIKIKDGFKAIMNKDLNNHLKNREETNSVYSNLMTSSSIFGDLSSSLVYFKDKDKYLFTFLNRIYDYQNESLWMSKESKEALYKVIKSELSKREKFKDI